MSGTRKLEIVDEATGEIMRRTTVFEHVDTYQQIISLLRDLQDGAQFGDLTDEERDSMQAQFDALLEQVQGSIDDKVDGALAVWDEMKLDWAAIEAKLKELTAICDRIRKSRRANENAQERLKGWFERLMGLQGVSKLKGKLHTVSLRKMVKPGSVKWNEMLTSEDKQVFFEGVGKGLCSATLTIAGITDPGVISKIQKYAGGTADYVLDSGAFEVATEEWPAELEAVRQFVDIVPAQDAQTVVIR